jgi:hypothetical protein
LVVVDCNNKKDKMVAPISDVVHQGIHHVQEIITYMEIPPLKDVYEATEEAWTETIEAVRSIGHLIVLVNRPMFFLAWWIQLRVNRIFWDYLYNHGLAQCKELWLGYWKFFFNLSFRGKCIISGLQATCVALYFLRRWLVRRGYIERARQFAIKKYDRTSKVGWLLTCLFVTL